ncbi:T-complex protein 1 subunit zeta [Fukomys damarensis]|uniref:40S ribosomal protein S15 n=1 Tax=Fukomys damarensis TaxID=885580 RepID=A0A091DSW1_FUKDA|nr:T-complex protein 1 subunit zeta [Fukomys damarensis]
MEQALIKHKERVKGQAQLGVHMFGQLLIIPEVLAQNSSFDLQETDKIQVEHTESGEFVGVAHEHRRHSTGKASWTRDPTAGAETRLPKSQEPPREGLGVVCACGLPSARLGSRALTHHRAAQAEVRPKQQRAPRKLTYRGGDFYQLLAVSYKQLMQIYNAWQRRQKQHKCLCKAKEAPYSAGEARGEDIPSGQVHPARDGGHLEVYDGRFYHMQIKPEKISHYWSESSITSPEAWRAQH